MPPGLLKHLPGGVFYVLGGMSEKDNNLWEVTPPGQETLLTRDPLNLDSMAVSPAGIVLSDSQHYVDQLARLTHAGLGWLHPYRHERLYIDGQLPDVRADGQIIYEIEPGYPGGDRSDFTVWAKRSFTGPEMLIFKSKNDPGTPVAGPDGQIAVTGPVGPYLAKGQVPGAVIISRSGHITRLETGGAVQGYPPVWGDNAAALVIPDWGNAGNAQVYYPDGKRGLLLTGWRPLAWSPSGSELLVQSGSELGLWRPREPRQVVHLGLMTAGFGVVQVSWLRFPAPR